MRSISRMEFACIFLVMPAILVRLVTSIYPIGKIFVDSLFDISLIRGTHNFVGLGNFVRMFNDINVTDTIAFSLYFTVASIVLHIVIGIPLALLLNQTFKGRKILRSVIIIPWALPMIAAGIAFSWGFNDAYGFVNDLIRRVVPDFQFHWTVTRDGARWAVIIADVWKGSPFYAIVMLSGLQTIPLEIYEAAKVDGASAWRRFWNITMPCLLPLITVMTIFFALWRLTQFDLVYSMTQGGPGNATSLLSYRIYVEAFNNLNFGYAAAISVFLCLTMVVIALVGFTIKRFVDFEL